MKSTVILPIFSNDSEAVRSIVSVINSDQKPTNLCIVTTNKLSENRLASINAMFKSCCDGGEYSESLSTDKKVIKKLSSDFNMFNIILNNPLTKHPNYYAAKYLSESDVFLTLTEGFVYQPESIGKILNKFEDQHIGAVYSDYIARGRYTFLPTLHIMARSSIPVLEIAFRNNLLDMEKITMQNGEIINNIYGKSIVAHIPEPLVIA